MSGRGSGSGGSTAADLASGRAGKPDLNAKLIDSTLLDADGNEVTNVEEGERIRLRARIEARRHLSQPVFAIHCRDEQGTQVFSLHRFFQSDAPGGDELEEGQIVEIAGAIDNPLTPGRYFLTCFVTSTRESEGVAVGVIDLLDFVVFGVYPEHGVVAVSSDVSVVALERGGRSES